MMLNISPVNSHAIRLDHAGLQILMPSIKKHLMELPDEDKHKRFYIPTSEKTIDKYLSSITIDDRGDAVFVVFNGNGSQVVGMCHVAISGVGETRSAELALTVCKEYRGKNIGVSMLERAIIHCKTIHITKIYMYCLSTNVAMQHMARKLGMQVFTEFGESTGSLNINDENVFAAIIEAATADTMALYDLNYRQAVNTISCFLSNMINPKFPSMQIPIQEDK